MYVYIHIHTYFVFVVCCTLWVWGRLSRSTKGNCVDPGNAGCSTRCCHDHVYLDIHNICLRVAVQHLASGIINFHSNFQPSLFPSLVSSFEFSVLSKPCCRASIVSFRYNAAVPPWRRRKMMFGASALIAVLHRRNLVP